MRPGTLSSSSALVCSLLLAACSGTRGSTPDELIGDATSADSDGFPLVGALEFNNALPHTNGRACATCHVAADAFALTPAHVAALYAENPHDPLFNPIDADDPTAAVPTYDHLKAGLVRITLTIADNVDVIDGSGDVITNAQRTISVWRGVPTIQNVFYTAPYQYDGRAPTLEVQADGALHLHSQITREPLPQTLENISAFESLVYSDLAAAEVAAATAEGRTPPPVDVHAPPGSEAAAGQAVFLSICAQCHGTPETNHIVNAAVLSNFFPVQNADGTVDVVGALPVGVAIPAAFRTDLGPPHEGSLGITALAVFGQLGILPNPSGLALPQYRIRFYTDATRTTKLVDMPPAPPGIGPALVPEPFTVDPGRAVVSGDPYDWEGFDVPQLRGISKTAPYFHDASAPDLPSLLDEYSRFLLPAVPALHLPTLPPEGPGLPPESLSPTQKAQLLAFLQLL